MYRTCNMGIGFARVVAAEAVDAVRTSLERDGLRVHALGRAIDDAARTIHFRPDGRPGRFTPA